jgi:hypothetical protein
MPTDSQSATVSHRQRPTQSPAQSHTRIYTQPSAVDEVIVVLAGLKQRELLEPAALLSAGYLAVPFMVKQLLLLLVPVLALLGFAPYEQGEQHDR